MPVKVYCPSCEKELNAPEDLIGKTVACPRCNERFPVGQAGNGATGSQPKQNLYPPGMNPPSPAAPASGSAMPRSGTGGPPSPPPQPAPSKGAARFRGAPDLGAGGGLGGDALSPAGMSPFVPPPLPPASVSPPGSAAPHATPPVVAPLSASPPRAMPPGSTPPGSTPPGSTPTLPGEPPRTFDPSPAPAPVAAPKPAQRTVKQARFVTAGETATHMKLGADGQLPQLALREGEQKEKKTEQRQGMNPLILVALLVSVGASVAILFLPETSNSESRNKAEARKALETYYIDTKGSIDVASPNKPYQYYLREALQAHRRGDYATELRSYRHVMNLLHSEGISETFGLTGKIGEPLRPGDSPLPPGDRHLEKQLSILLSD